ncbi:ABC transporter ATP-binding protein [Treponema sp. UBA3813]|uniref:ABC transporter ATP-binding protein n=1 Tax=Treponema sp. UBA3813 TaxID=1947715 RepID=UPI0025FE1911|nr:ABC transporter ATP-binding protein [Treponema sp. UBA3813]
MKNFLKIFKILTRRQMTLCSFLIVLMLIIAVFEALGIGLLYPLINIIGNPNWLEDHEKIAKILSVFGINSHRKLIFFASISLFAFYVFKNFLILWQGKIQINFSLNNQRDYSKRLYAYYMNKPYLYHLDTNISVISRNIHSGGDTVFSQILISTLQIMTNIITIIVIWAFICFMDWLIAIGVAFILGPLVLAMLNYFRKKIGIAGTIQNKCQINNGKWINQGFYSVKETKVMQREDYFISEFDKSYTEFIKSNKDFLFVQRFPKSIIELFTIGGILILIAVKMILDANPASLIPTLGVLALAAVRLMPSLNQMIAMFNSIKFRMPLFTEMFNDLMIVRNNKDLEEQNFIKKSESTLNFDNEISIQNLTFAYPSKKEDVLSNVSFTIPKGSFIGIIGPSGAGKTTFVDILLGLLPPKSGTITVDGHDIHKNLSSWLNNIAYVPQSIYLIDGSIKDNIAFGLAPEEIDDSRILEVLRMAELYDFVQTLPEKENTNVGDRGAKLSGGQKQRIGIARALYHNPNVLILDEATSALDNETEKQITDTILKLKGKITIIAIAHRLSTLENCDFKIKFDGGKAERV